MKNLIKTSGNNRNSKQLTIKYNNGNIRFVYLSN